MGKEEEVMVNKVRPALSGFHLGSDESWRQLKRQGHLQQEILGKTVGCHMPQGPGFQSSQGGKGNPRSSWSNQRCELQLVWEKERQEAALPWFSGANKVTFGRPEAQLGRLMGRILRESEWNW